MKVEIIESKPKFLKIKIVGEDHTLLGPLTYNLIEDDRVEFATYDIEHPLVGEPLLRVKTKVDDPLIVLKDALSSLISQYDEFIEKFRRCLNA